MSATLFTGGVVWTGTGSESDALLVTDGVVAAVGGHARSRAAGLECEHIDLGGGFLMPSFGDGHAHPLYGGLEAVGPAVRSCGSVDEILSAVKKYADEHPDEEWILGASYDGSLAPGGLFDARWLDSVVPDRPVALRAWDYHTMWVNTAALERAGITPDTPDPVLGEIPRRPDGSVLGTLREWGAVDLVAAVMPARDERQRVGALGTAADYFLSRGVTWVQDAWVEPGDVATYLEAARRHALRMRFNLALYADPRHFDSQVTDYAEARRAVDAAGSPLLTAQTVKFFADGVVENETGALLAPYCSGLHSHSGGAEPCDWGTTWACATGRATRWPRRPVASTSSDCRSTSMPSVTPRSARPSTPSNTCSSATEVATAGPSSPMSSWSTRPTSAGSPPSASFPTCSRCGPRWMR